MAEEGTAARTIFRYEESEAREPAGPRAFVTGWPVWHSRSPLIHRFWLEEFGIDGVYQRHGVPPEEIEEFFEGLRESGFAGGNVTIPHKEAAFAAAEKHDAAAEAIGAVNTLWFEGETLVGGNTDAYGFAANLDERLPGWGEAETALVLGAGGAARAVVHALTEKGMTVRIVNRTRARAEAIAERYATGVSAHDEAERDALYATTDLLVNTVPVPAGGEAENADAAAARAAGLPVGGPSLPDLSALPDHALVTDIVYVPLETPWLEAAEARGLKTADGLGMLLHQAVPGFERWFGKRPAVTQALRAAVLRDIERGV